jgi:PAS domain S-box-containing protein
MWKSRDAADGDCPMTGTPQDPVAQADPPPTDSPQRRHAEDVLLRVAQSVSIPIGDQFFVRLTGEMVDALGVEGGMIASVRENPRHARSQTFNWKGISIDNVSYELTGTPCESVIEGKARVITAGVRELFPGDTMLHEFQLEAYAGAPLRAEDGTVIGLVAAFSQRPIDNPELVMSALRIVAARASNEIERMAATDALRASEARLRRTFRDAATGIVVTSADGRILEANDSFCRMVGFTEAQLHRLMVIALVHQDDRAGLSEQFAQLLDGRLESVVTERRFRPGNGTTVWSRISASLQRDLAGRITGMIAVTEDITEQKRVQGELQDSQALHRVARRMGRMGAWSVAVPSMAMTWSEETRAIHEAEDDSTPLTADYVLSFFPPDSQRRLSRMFEDSVTHGVSFDEELPLMTARGHRRTIRLIGEAVRGDGGQVVRVQGALQDVTEAKRREEDLTRLASHLSNTLESITDAVIVLDRQWRFTLLNTEAEKMVDVPADELLGRVIWDCFPDVVGTSFEQHYRRAVEDNVTVAFEEEYVPSGRWFDVRAFPSADGLTIYLRDVTEQHLARQTLLESEERFQLLSKATNDAIWDWNFATNSLTWNEGFVTLFGYSREEVEPTVECWYGRLHPEDSEGVLASIHEVINGAKSSWSSEYRFRRKDGSYANVLDRGYVIRAADGHAVRMIGGMTDITARKRLEAQVLRAQRMEGIGRLAGGIAHDLNNVLAPILLSIDLLRNEPDAAARGNILDTIAASAGRGADMVRQVLTFARGVDGQRVAVQMGPTLKDIEKLATETFPRNVRVRANVISNAAVVLGDPTQLHQVFLNLAVNARDAMPDGGALTLSAEITTLTARQAAEQGLQPGRYVAITVEDTGTGIPPEIVESIFDPFFTTKEPGKGTGLGLPTTLAIVQSHGGTIRVSSKPGVGTRFRVLLPVLPALTASTIVPDRAAPSKLPRGHGELIMVVDDDEGVRRIITRALEAFGYRVIVAHDGSEAVATYRERGQEIALVLTDMMMPNMDGHSAIQALQALNPDVRIIASSGLDTSARQPAADAAGVKYFLPKPHSIETLLTLTERALQDR